MFKYNSTNRDLGQVFYSINNESNEAIFYCFMLDEKGEKEIKFYRCDKGAEPQYAVDIKDAAEFEMCPWTHPIEAVVNSFIYHRHLRCAQLMADANEIYKARTKEYEEQINKQDATKNEAPSAEEYAEIMITTELADPVLRTTLSPQQQAKNILKRLEATGIKVSYDEEVFYAQPSS